MIVKEYIKEFEKLGFGMFVHFGLYSVNAKGEWAYHLHKIPNEKSTKYSNPKINDNSSASTLYFSTISSISETKIIP